MARRRVLVTPKIHRCTTSICLFVASLYIAFSPVLFFQSPGFPNPNTNRICAAASALYGCRATGSMAPIIAHTANPSIACTTEFRLIMGPAFASVDLLVERALLVPPFST